MSGVSGVSGVSEVSGVSGMSGVSESEPNGEVNGHGNCSYRSVRHYNYLIIISIFLRLCDGNGIGIGELPWHLYAESLQPT